LDTVVAGTLTTNATVSYAFSSQAWYVVTLTVFASGRAIATVEDTSGAVLVRLDKSLSVLATGGTLATGKPGIQDRNPTSTVTTRWFDDIFVSVPAAEPIALYSGRNMQFRHDDTIRQDSTAVYTGRPPSYRGSRFLVLPGTSRVLVKARRNDVDSAADDAVTDATQIQVAYTPRGLVVSR
jgi:hypothetical protein